MNRMNSDMSHAITKILIPNLHIFSVSVALIWGLIKILKYFKSGILDQAFFSRKKLTKEIKDFTSANGFDLQAVTSRLIMLESGFSGPEYLWPPYQLQSETCRRRHRIDAKDITSELARFSADKSDRPVTLFRVARRNRVRMLKDKMHATNLIKKSIEGLDDDNIRKYVSVSDRLLIQNERESETYNDNVVGAILVESVSPRFVTYMNSEALPKRYGANTELFNYNKQNHESFSPIALGFLKLSTKVFIPSIVEVQDVGTGPVSMIEGMQWIDQAWMKDGKNFDVVCGDTFTLGYVKGKLVSKLSDVNDAFTTEEVARDILPNVSINIIKFANAFAMFPLHAKEMLESISRDCSIVLSEKEKACLTKISRTASAKSKERWNANNNYLEKQAKPKHKPKH